MDELQPADEKAQSRQHDLAAASLVSGLASIPLFPFVIFGAIAVITGLLARRGIVKSQVGRKGRAMALDGIILGGYSLLVCMMNLPTASQDRPRKTISLAIAHALEVAINNFYSEYGSLPDVGTRVQTDTAQGVKLLTVLLGLEQNGDKNENPRDIKFLSVKEGKDKKNGIIFSSQGDLPEGLYDYGGSPFTVVLDTRIAEHLQFNIGTKPIDIKGRRVAVFSPGPDKKLGTDDDIRTW